MKTLPDGQVDGPEPLFPPKKGHFFGKSRTSNLVGYFPYYFPYFPISLTKTLSY